jgi:hypothetical protein
MVHRVLRLLFAIIPLLLLATSPVLRAEDFSNPTGYLLAQSEERQVWVNTATGIYHYPGTRWYGNTSEQTLNNVIAVSNPSPFQVVRLDSWKHGFANRYHTACPKKADPKRSGKTRRAPLALA